MIGVVARNDHDSAVRRTGPAKSLGPLRAFATVFMDDIKNIILTNDRQGLKFL